MVERKFLERGKSEKELRRNILSLCEEAIGKDNLASPTVKDEDLGCETLEITRLIDGSSEEDIGFRVDVESFQLKNGVDLTFRIFYSTKNPLDYLENQRNKTSMIMEKTHYVILEQLLLSAHFEFLRVQRREGKKG